MNDINDGILYETPVIVLANSITLSNAYTITNPMTIMTNGYNLTGSLTINDDNTSDPDALLTVLGNGSISTVTLGSYYDKSGARELVAAYAEKQLKYGIKAGTTPESIDIVGPYAFYNMVISTDGAATYVSPNLTASSTLKYNNTETLTFTLDGTSTVTYRHIGIKSDFSEETVLNHLPADGDIITSDLFLPTSVPSCNASIIWKSSDTGIMTEEGRIVSESNDRNSVTLVATIKVNDTVTTRTYTFYVTSNNNKVNFQKLVKDISPLIIKKKYSESDADNTTYYLPIVTEATGDTFDTYDYRTSYSCPASDATFTWAAHESIRLSSLTYEKYYDGTEDSPVDTYDYITVSGNAITLTKDTLSNYAKIKITGTFDNGEVYTSIVNISIALGSDTELLEKAFNNVNNAIDEISVLGNIIETRISDGMTAEKGDFTLPATYGDSYTISYEVADSSGIISVGKKAEEVDGELVYKFTVDPTKFDTVETSVPVQATVTYTKSDDSTVTKTKIIYIDTPAAVHVSDLGNVSIFNTLKYQVESALPSAEKNGLDFSESGNVTYSGYDYILLRDIVGDEQYLSDYAQSSLYLTVNDYKADGSDGADGVTTIKLYNASENPTSTTDTLAYDFVKLIQWATGNTKVLASSVLSSAGKNKLSSTLQGYKSNGETYLTESELAVIKAFYQACTGASDDAWTAIQSQTLETAPGRIYDNADLLVTILNCLTSEKGTDSGWYENASSGTYGKIYAKYLEVLNRYAITTSENEERMSPAQEVYNSKYYYSFTTTAAFTNSSSSTCNVSIPCQYYDADGNLVSGYCNRYQETNWHGYSSGNNQGTYAASSATGNTAVDLYANTGDGQQPYDSDHTKYITSAELMVLKAFWLGAIGGTSSQTASSNVLKEFGTDSQEKIAAALAADANGILPYPNYSASDFQYYGQAILNALDACLVTPTTFTSNGIGTLINSFYENFNSKGYQVKTYGSSTDTTTFVSTLVNGVPAVTNLDNLEGALSYFSGLTTIDIKGNSSLSIFLSDYGLSTAFARITLTNSDITTLAMEYVSPDWNDFDITNIKHLDDLTTIDLSNNLGIKTLNPLLNVNHSNYTSVNVANIGEVYEYNEFVIDNLSSCSVTYSNAKNDVVTQPNSATSSVLVNLSDIEDLVSEHLYLTNVIYNEDGTTTDVCWRVEQGNEMNGEEINQGGELVKFETVNDMNMRISPYYYCETAFTYDGYSFKANHLYQVVYNNGAIAVQDLNGDDYSITLIDDASDVDNTNLTDTSGDEVDIETNDEYDRTSTATSLTGNIYTQTFTSSDTNVTYTINMYYQVFSFNTYNEQSDYDGLTSAGYHTYYLMANGTEVRAGYLSSINSSCYIVLLPEKQAKFIDYLNNNGNEISSAEMTSTYGVSADSSDVVTLGTQNLSATVSSVYIYSVSEKKFLNSGGFDTVLGDQFSVTKNGSYWYIKDTTKNKYLDTFKQLITTSDGTSNVISAVFNKSTVTTDTIDTSSAYTSNSKYYNSNWTLSTNNVSATSEIGGATYSYSASVNTPTITVTTKEGKKYTATFKCYTIRNARLTNTYTNPNTGTTASRGYAYDNGATLLLSINDTQPTDYSYYFTLLNDADVATLNAWYENPDKDITIGETVSMANNSSYEYYIYNPFTRRYATGTYATAYGSAFYTTLTKPTYGFDITFMNGSPASGYRIVFYDDVLTYTYTQATDITRNNFSTYKSELYTLSDGTYSSASSSNYRSRTTYYRRSSTYVKTPCTKNGDGTTYLSWNAFGGISDYCYGIATYEVDDGSCWVFDDVQTENQYTYSYQEPSVTVSNIAYKLDYTVNLVNAHIVKSEITRYYEFDKFYYLDEDVTIDGNVYKKGNVIRFAYNAYYGKSYEAYIMYYEVVFTYTKSDGTTDTYTDPNNLSFIYYITSGNGASGEIAYTYWSNSSDPDDDTFEGYKSGFTITIDDSTTTVKYYDETNTGTGNKPIQWIYTEDSFNEVKYKLYDDEYGMTNSSSYVDGNVYYTPTYTEATIFADTFNARKTAGTLYEDANGTALASTATYDATTVFYEVGNVEIDNTASTGGIASTITKSGYYLDESNNKVTSEYSFRLYDYYKFGIYDVDGNRLPFNSKYSATGTYYFKHTDANGNVTYTTATPQVYDVTSSQYIYLTLDEETFYYFLNTLTYLNADGTYVEVADTDEYNGDYAYYIQTFVVSDFRQELLDQYNAVLYTDSTGTAVGTDATFNTARTYYTNVFEEVENMSASIFNTYKSVLYSDAYGTALSDDATYDSSKTYYKKYMEVSSPEPSGDTEFEWHETSNITRLYSHAKNTSDVDDDGNSVLSIYKEDCEHISKVWYQYTGADTDGENIYSNPTITYVYEPMLNGLVSADTWSKYKSSIYIKNGTSYTSCVSLDWQESYEKLTFYRYVLSTTANITTAGSSYSHNYGYKMGQSSTNIFGIENDYVLVWTNPTAGVSNSGGTMDSILEEANTHFNDLDYNLWYGKHYAYNGFTMESSLVSDTNTEIVNAHDADYTNVYQKGYVYRLVVNSLNTGFMWERVYTYSRQGGAAMVTASSTGTATVGDTIWTTSDCFSGFYTANKFYRVVEDDFTKTLNVIQFNDVTLVNHNDDGYTDLQSDKIHYIYQGNYLGYAGNFEIVISAVVRIKKDDGTYTYSDTVRTYKIKFVGAVIA